MRLHLVYGHLTLVLPVHVSNMVNLMDPSIAISHYYSRTSVLKLNTLESAQVLHFQHALDIHTVVYCESPPVPANGLVTYNNQNNPTAFNSIVTYTCGSGYVMHGGSTRQCTTLGEWSGNAPTCTGKSN